MDEIKNTHGGKRREGRNQTMRSYRIDNDLIEELAGMKNTNAFINEAIREKIKREVSSREKLKRNNESSSS